MRKPVKPPAPPLSAEAFIAWAHEAAEDRYALQGGAVVAMAPGRAAHARAKLAVAMARPSLVNPFSSFAAQDVRRIAGDPRRS